MSTSDTEKTVTHMLSEYLHNLELTRYLVDSSFTRG